MFKVGDKVKLKIEVRKSLIVPEGRENNLTAKIYVFLSDIEGGLKFDRDLGGARYWNIEDIEHA